MKRVRIQAVVFDLFHTLVDPEVIRPKDFRRAYRIAEVLSVKDAEKFAFWWRENERERHIAGSKKVAEFIDDYLWETAGRHCTREQLEQIDHITGHLQDLAILSPIPEALETLKRLRDDGLKLGLLSNIDEREARHWESSPLMPLFEAVCFSFKIGWSKPSTQAYSTILESLGVPAGVSAYVGDGGHDELSGARRAGFGFIVYAKGIVSSSGIRSPDIMDKHGKEADATITNLRELPPLIYGRALGSSLYQVAQGAQRTHSSGPPVPKAPDRRHF
jgi:putative hydrolase of the HAD superfamily